MTLLRTGFALLFGGLLTITESATSWAAESPGDGSRPQMLHLHAEFLPYKQPVVDKPLGYRLGREMSRQALLQAAREEMGLLTCDETLHETPCQDAEVVDLMLIERASSSSGIWDLKLIKYQAGQDIHGTKPLWSKQFKSAVGGVRVYGLLTPKLEADTRGDFVQALQAAGLRQRSPAEGKPVPPSAEIEQALGKVDFIAQFGAVRSAHQAIAAHGETPQWFGVLVRGYANLAILTQHQWSSSSEVFTARSWLYAERMFASKKERDSAIWHRAYAWALGGALQHALEDLDRIKERKAKNMVDASFVAPPWTKLVEAYAMCDRAAVKRVGEEEPTLLAWATFLNFQLTNAYRLSQWSNEAADEVLRVCPTAYGVFNDLVLDSDALLMTRKAAWTAPTMYGLHAPASLIAMPGSPEELRMVLRTGGIASALVGDVYGDPNPQDPLSAVPTGVAGYLRERSRQSAEGDLSWSALAVLLEDETLLQGANYLGVVVSAVEASRVAAVDSVLPLVRDHRFAPYIESYRGNQSEAHQLLKDVEVPDPRRNMGKMLYRIEWANTRQRRPSEYIEYRANLGVSRGFTMQGMLEYVYPSGPGWEPSDTKFGEILAREYAGIAPHSEIRIRMAIQVSENPTAEEMGKWEAEIKEDPTAFNALAWRYFQQGGMEAAERCLKKSLALLPTLYAARLLANVYLSQGDRQKWEKTLSEFLESEDLGLAHATVRKDLAYGLMSWGDWAKAKPYAEAAGQTWSAWGLEVASYACESLAEWSASEEWIRSKSMAYTYSNGYEWYYWCRRTGRGDVQPARQLAEKYYKNALEYLRINSINRGAFELLEGKISEAREAYRKAVESRPSFTCTFMVAQLSRDLKDENSRREAISAMEEAVGKLQGNPLFSREGDAAGLAVLELLKTGDATPERLNKIDESLVKIEPAPRSTFAYVVGKELAALGRTTDAEKYWRRALVIPGGDRNFATLAGVELAKLHGTSRPDDDVLGPDDLWPPVPADGNQQ